MTVERATRNFKWVFGLYLLRSLVRFGYLVSFARLLRQQGFGSYYFLLSVVAVLVVVRALGLNVFLIRQVNRRLDAAEGLISRCFGLNMASAVVVGAALLLVAPFTNYPEEVRLGMMIMGLTIIPLGLIGMLHSVGAAYENLRTYAVLENATPLVEAGIGIVLLLNGFGLLSLCTLHLVLYSLYALVFVILTRRQIVKFTFRFDWRAWGGYLAESWKIWVFAAQSVLYAHLGVIILSALTGNEKVAYFAAAMVLLEPVRRGAIVFQSVVFPYMVRAWERDPEELGGFQESCLRLLAAASVPAGLLGVLLARPVVGLLFGEGYLASVRVLQILAWLVFPLFVEHVLVRVCHASGHFWLPVIGHGIVNVARIGLSVVLVLVFAERPSEGLAWAMLASSVVGFAVYTALIRCYIFKLRTLASLGRTAAAAVVPVALLALLDGRVNVVLLAAMIVAAFAAGVFVFRLFTAREFEIIRRALLSFTGRTPDVET